MPRTNEIILLHTFTKHIVAAKMNAYAGIKPRGPFNPEPLALPQDHGCNSLFDNDVDSCIKKYDKWNPIF